MLLSERLGITKPKILQIESMDDDLKNSLYNNLIIWEESSVLSYISKVSVSDMYRNDIYTSLWIYFCKRPIDEISNITHRDYLLGNILKYSWIMFYDFLQAYISYAKERFDVSKLITMLNETLKRENSGYRVVDEEFIEITNEGEIKEIEDAISTPYESVNKHLKAAIDLFADKENKQYRNVIKESISGVEAIANIINGSEGASLGKALNKLNSTHIIHPAMIKGFTELYGYSSDKESGIRHYLNENPLAEPDFADAKYMLVSCSAFINYLILRAQETGFLK